MFMQFDLAEVKYSFVIHDEYIDVVLLDLDDNLISVLRMNKEDADVVRGKINIFLAGDSREIKLSY